MNPNERIPLLCGYLFAALAVLGVVGIFVTAASTAAVCVFALGVGGVIAATVGVVQTENGAQWPG